MDAKSFCYWLRGFFELTQAGLNPENDLVLTKAQVDMINKHLESVFNNTIMTQPNIIINPTVPNTGDVPVYPGIPYQPSPGTGGWPFYQGPGYPIVTCSTGSESMLECTKAAGPTGLAPDGFIC